MLTVIGAGFPRTGTTSLKAALERLGFGPCYHMFEVMRNPGHVDRWLAVLSDDPPGWDQVLAGYRSAVDWPASFFWSDLAAAYPDAKIILSTRDPHRWYRSFRTLITRPRPPIEEGAEVHPALAAMARMRPVLQRMGQVTFGGDSWEFGATVPEEEQAVEVFRRHNAAVQAAVPADRLLTFDVAEGWDPLCRFLGVEVPAGEPFPHLNDTETMGRMFEEMIGGGGPVTPFDAPRPRA
ncbi:sulfotransferase family protein [Sphaerisporangium rufum]|uniref:Sulfotransferase family protein n=1 Tax=Sphaerisporangium rufum TaxID=1381558 RepID=A0A919R022_9ACTN|nr:sulfotransferase family protein [Sphaerisporangium rufum]GII77179.1 sulfotransferase family protein [Sphaerisporangium rufum]